jgi:hypothetical protein
MAKFLEAKTQLGYAEMREHNKYSVLCASMIEGDALTLKPVPEAGRSCKGQSTHSRISLCGMIGCPRRVITKLPVSRFYNMTHRSS